MRAPLIAGLTMALALAGCGGGDAGQRANVQVLPEELLTPPCPVCQPASLQGVVAAGAPLVDAEVTAFDAQGAQRSTRTDAKGRYLLPVQSMQAPLVVRAQGWLNGEWRSLHTVVLPTEVGRALSHLTPLTEVLAAQVLQGMPQDLMAQAQLDHRRITTQAVRSAHAELERLIRPVLDAAGVPTQVDLRASPFEANHTGMDLALDWLVLSLEQGAHRLRHVQMPLDQGLVLDPVGASSTDALPAPTSVSNLNAITTQVNASLASLTQRFAQRIPEVSELSDLLTADFLGDGLDASGYIQQVWRRQDSARAGGFSLASARWFGATIVQMRSDSEVLVRLRVAPRAPHAPYNEQSWFQKVDGQWLWRGNRQLASPVVRHASVLLDGPLGGRGQVSEHLVFEVDKRRVDARVVQIQVQGPGLPAPGVSLAPPPDDDESIRLWTWAGRPSDEWPALPWGWCPSGDAQTATACSESWQEVRSGSSYQFTLMDANRQVLQTLTASLPPLPEPWARRPGLASAWFQRWLAGAADEAWLPGSRALSADPLNPHRGEAPLIATWTGGREGALALEALFERHVLTPASASTEAALSVQRTRQAWQPLPWATQGQASITWDRLLSEQKLTWASHRLNAIDAQGHWRVHALSGSNTP